MIRLEETDIQGLDYAIRWIHDSIAPFSKSDSAWCSEIENCDECNGKSKCPHYNGDPYACSDVYVIGKKDYNLLKKLTRNRELFSSYRQMIAVYVDITAPLYWWREFNFYYTKNGVNNFLCLDKIIKKKKFTLDDFSYDQLIKSDSILYFDTLDAIIYTLNVARDLYVEEPDDLYLQQIFQLLPTSYNLKRTVVMDYDVLAKVYSSYKKSKLKEWRDFINWIDTLPYSEEIIKSNKKRGENN